MNLQALSSPLRRAGGFGLALWCSLALFPATAQTQQSASPMTVQNWRLNLHVSAGSTPDNSTTYGTDPAATNGVNDDFDFPNPPAIGPPLTDAYFFHLDTEPGWFNFGGNYATDIRAPLNVGDQQAWPLQIAYDPGGATGSQSVEISWPEVNQVPAAITLLLRDADDLDGDGKNEYNMRQFTNFNLPTVPDGVLHKYNLVLIAALSDQPRLGGDLNNDGRVNIQDATLALQASVGQVVLSSDEIAAGDLNKDGKVNVQDVTRILRIAVGAEPAVQI